MLNNLKSNLGSTLSYAIITVINCGIKALADIFILGISNTYLIIYINSYSLNIRLDE